MRERSSSLSALPVDGSKHADPRHASGGTKTQTPLCSQTLASPSTCRTSELTQLHLQALGCFSCLGGLGLIITAHRKGTGLTEEGPRRQRKKEWARYLITRGCVYFCSQRLGFGLGGKEVLCFIEAEAQDLSIQVIILIPQLMILLCRRTKATSAPRSIQNPPEPISWHSLSPDCYQYPPLVCVMASSRSLYMMRLLPGLGWRPGSWEVTGS